MSAAGVSVIIPAFNRAAFLRECITSVFATGQAGLEVLVVDDGSIDATAEVLAKLAAAHAGLRVLRHPGGERRGVSASRNLALSQALGEFVCFLDSDDLMLPRRFAHAMAILAASPSVDGVVEVVEIEYEDGRLLVPQYFARDLGSSPDGAALIGGVAAPASCGLLLRRKVFERSGVFDARRSVGEDYHLWLRIMATSRIVPGDPAAPVARVRKHGGNTSGYSTAEVELEVVRDVHAWARAQDVPTPVVAALRRKYFDLLYYYAQEPLRAQAGALGLLGRAAVTFPSVVLTRRFWGNVRNAVGGLSRANLPSIHPH